MIANSGVSTQRTVAATLSALRVRLGIRVWLGFLISGSTLARFLAARPRSAPSYFPDEYIYTALARSLGTVGKPLVRGGSAHFPALLEPLLAAPLWLLASTQTAYRLVQLENALFMSLAALPVYLLARRLDLSRGYGFACAAFALAIPDLAFSAFTISDPVAYPLVIFALYAGVIALQAPGWRKQLAFIALATLATLTRVQFVVLLPAFVAAGLALERRAFLRLYRLPLALVAAAAAIFVARGPHRVLGYYAAVGNLHLSTDFLRWAGLDLVLLSLAGGVALVPGALVGIVTARGRRESAFAALVVPFALAVMVEAALYASNGSGRFKERYLFILLPLLPIAFGLYLKRGKPGRVPVTALAVGVALGAALLPLSSYVQGERFDDSPLLWCLLELQTRVGASDTRLLVVGCVITAAAAAAAAAWTRITWPALAAALSLVALLSVGATSLEITVSKQVRRQITAPNPSWIDAAHVGPVAAIETDLASPAPLLEQLFWNRSIDQELLFGTAPAATDPMSTGSLTVLGNGELLVNDPSASSAPEAVHPLESAFLFQGFEVAARILGARPVARYSSFTLWRPAGTPRLSTYELGRYWDGWLAPQGGLEVWPGAARAGTLSFTLSLPSSRPAPVTISFGQRSYRLSPGGHVAVRIGISGQSRWSTRFTATAGAGALADNRDVSVRSTTPLFTPA